MAAMDRRIFLKNSALASGAAASTFLCGTPASWASSLEWPIGLQLYSVRDSLPKDFDGTLHQLAAMGYRECEGAGFFGHSAADVKKSMSQAGLQCVSAHYSLQLLQSPDEILSYGRDLGLEYIVCSSPMPRDPAKAKGHGWAAAVESMSADDWKWVADQLNTIGKRVQAAGMKFGYHNHYAEFHQHDGFLPYDVLLESTDAKLVDMEMDCGWVVIGGQTPEDYLTRYPNRYVMLHVKEFKLDGWKPGTPPVSTELGRGSIDYKSIFAAAKKARVKHIFVEQEAFPDLPEMEAMKANADWLRTA
jgi:sugar phosphate isomerase/epimerase